MEIKPSENRRLYGMSHFFNELVNLFKEKTMPNKILLSGKKGLGKSTLAYHVINYILSLDEEHKYDVDSLIINEENRSFRLLQNNSHPNFFLIDLIDEKKNIDVGQIREMIVYTNKSSFNNMPRFILIDNIENLNKNSINALLKIIEEPNDNIFFILINNNEKNVLPTLKSRCLNFKINFSFNESMKVTNLLLNKNIFELMHIDLISYYSTPGEIINLINFAEEKEINLEQYDLNSLLELFINNAYYKKNKNVKKMILNFMELFFLKEYKLRSSKNSFLNIYNNFLYKIHNTEKFNLDEESLFLEFKSKLLNG
jgi:DNA polymerase III subunit delta'